MCDDTGELGILTQLSNTIYCEWTNKKIIQFMIFFLLAATLLVIYIFPVTLPKLRIFFSKISTFKWSTNVPQTGMNWK